jgi:hypothetical protein
MDLDSNDIVRFSPEEERALSLELEDNPVRDALRAHWAEVERISAILLEPE